LSRRSTILVPSSHDGTSQRGRALPALDPGYAAIDERSTADLLAFVQAFAERLRYFSADELADELREAGTWASFAQHRDEKGNVDVSLADIVAYIDEPERFTGERARWLGRPHFALLLTFLELLGHARAQLNDLTRRHLEYYYRDVLQMLPEPAQPDRAAMVFRLASRVAEVRLPAGTALQAGRDSSGVPRIYRTERDLYINRAEVAELRSVFVHRRITGISDVRRDRSLTGREAFEGTLRIALGVPAPGDPVPPWQGKAIDFDFVTGLRAPLDFTTEHLYLEHHELRVLMQRVRRRDAADAEWAEINRLLGVTNPARPRDFAANLESRVGKLDFKADGLPQVSNIDQLYEHRTETDVRAYIDQRLAAIGYDNFVALMPIKLRIDAEWAEINRLLERAGRRQRGMLSWSLAPADPTAFTANLTKALTGNGAKWPPPWPSGSKDIYEYEARLRQLEVHFSMSVERLDRVVAFAEQLAANSAAEDFDWSEIDRILADAHREQVYARRRARLAEVRGARNDLAGFDAVVTFVLSEPDKLPEKSIAWDDARAALAQYLDKAQLDVLDRFRQQLADPTAAQRVGWPDVYQVLELAQRYVEGMPEPIARKTEWRNLYAHADASAQRVDADASPRWRTFGSCPPSSDKLHPPTMALGWALRSPMLALSQGTRKLTLTFGFAAESFDLTSFAGQLGLTPAEITDSKLGEPRLRAALAGALVVEVSTAKGWIELAIDQAGLATGSAGNDYWSLRGVARPVDEDRPALQLVLTADVTRDPVAPLTGADLPALRLLLRQRWDEGAKEWITLLAPFEPLRLTAVHLRVDVDGLSELSLQQDDRVLDPRKPFQPFGSQPAVGSRLYLSHPELVRGRLDMLRFDIEWMGLPASLARHYVNYPGITGAESFKIRMALIDRNLELALADAALFEDDAQKITSPTRSLDLADVPAALKAASPGFAYTRRLELAPGGDLRAASRHLRWELRPNDFGHDDYPALAAGKSRELSIVVSGAVAQGTTTDPAKAADYQVNPPYTPTIKRLSVSYRTSIELDPAAPTGADRLLHVHPFGEAPLHALGDVVGQGPGEPPGPGLFPRYDQAGELYIGLRDFDPPPGQRQHLALLLQLAEGTSDPEIEPAPVSWSWLDADRWQDLDDGRVLYDSTRGLINSGIVELALPGAAPSALLPGDLHWLRVAIARSPTSVCDTVDIRAQAVTVRFEDGGNAADHYQQPLPVATIDRLVEPDARIAAIEQPFTSSGGKPAERPETFYTRVSERLRHKQRALTPWDYERLVLQRFGQIYKAKCLSASAATDPGHVDMIVIPDIREMLPSDAFAPRAPANLLADIQTYLGERAPASASIRVRNAQYVPVLVRLGVRFMPGVEEGFARKRLNDDLVRFLSPWAYDEGAELMIGGKIYASSIIDFVDRRDYVDYVAEVKLFRGRGDDDFAMIPPQVDYHVATDRPDQVLVAARQHVIDVIPELGYQQTSFNGLNYMKLELDFIVG
jgi:Baseplate J-like protein